MVNLGLTGGIAAGKSAAATRFAQLGAIVVDSDVLARSVVRAGQPGFDAVVSAFGHDVVAADGELDRARLAQRVFGDEQARTKLNGIVHPLVRLAAAELVAAVPAGAVVVHDIPLLVENNLMAGFDAVVVVQAPLQVRLARLTDRGIGEPAAAARIASQASDIDRAVAATFVIQNDRDIRYLHSMVDVTWKLLMLG